MVPGPIKAAEIMDQKRILSSRDFKDTLVKKINLTEVRHNFKWIMLMIDQVIPFAEGGALKNKLAFNSEIKLI